MVGMVVRDPNKSKLLYDAIANLFSEQGKELHPRALADVDERTCTDAPRCAQ